MFGQASRPGRQRGLTLIETVFALAILAVAFMALLQASMASSSLSVSSSEDSEAVLFAQNKLEEMQAAPFATVLTTYAGTAPAPGGGFYATGDLQSLAFQPLTALGPATTGWTPAIVNNYMAIVDPLAPAGANIKGTHEQLSRLKVPANGTPMVTIHFLSESELYTVTGIADQIDVLTNPITQATPVASRTANIPASVPAPGFVTVTTTSFTGGLWTWVNTNYSYYPVRITVTWAPLTNQTNAGQALPPGVPVGPGAVPLRTVSIMGVIYPQPKRA